MKRLIVAITGASGAIYARHLLKKLAALQEEVETHVILSTEGERVWQYELEEREIVLPDGFICHKEDDFFASPASGSAAFDAMVIIPCTTGTLGRIAGGISNNLITRAADVMLKEKRSLVLVLRETPLNLIHIKNMELLTQAGATIFPAAPSFYAKPKSLEEMVDQFVNRLLQFLKVTNNGYRWGEEKIIL